MLKIQVLGNGFIPRGLGIAPRREPFKADLLLIQTILASPARFTINMFHPETGKIIEITNKNVMSLWEKYSNYESQQPPVVPGDKEETGDKEDFKEDEFEEDKSEDESENESEDKNEDKEDSLSVQMPIDEEEKVEATSNVSLHDEVEIKITHEETSTPIQPNVNETINVHNGNNSNNNYQNKSQKSQKNKKH